jgi:hypothetical protein
VITDLAGGRRETLPRRRTASRVRLGVSDDLPRLAFNASRAGLVGSGHLSVQKGILDVAAASAKSYPALDNFRLSPRQKDFASPQGLR